MELDDGSDSEIDAQEQLAHAPTTSISGLPGPAADESVPHVSVEESESESESESSSSSSSSSSASKEDSDTAESNFDSRKRAEKRRKRREARKQKEKERKEEKKAKRKAKRKAQRERAKARKKNKAAAAEAATAAEAAAAGAQTAKKQSAGKAVSEQPASSPKQPVSAGPSKAAPLPGATAGGAHHRKTSSQGGLKSTDLGPFISYGVGEALKNHSRLSKSDFRKQNTYRLAKDNTVFSLDEYAPGLFSSVRSRFGISEDQYHKSLVEEGIHGGLVGDGKSGMLFYFSRCKRFVIKTIKVTKSVALFFLRLC